MAAILSCPKLHQIVLPSGFSQLLPCLILHCNSPSYLILCRRRVSSISSLTRPNTLMMLKFILEHRPSHPLCPALTHPHLRSFLLSSNLPAASAGDFSFAAVQANTLMEDVGVVESGPWGTNAAVFDGHAGTQASHFLGDNFFSILRSE